MNEISYSDFDSDPKLVYVLPIRIKTIQCDLCSSYANHEIVYTDGSREYRCGHHAEEIIGSHMH